MVIVTHPALERERQLELTRVVRALHRQCDAYERAVQERRVAVVAAGADGGVREMGVGRKRRRRSVLGGGELVGDEHEVEERRQVANIAEIRKPAKSTFVLKAMAKMLMKRDRERSEEEQRRVREITEVGRGERAWRPSPARQQYRTL